MAFPVSPTNGQTAVVNNVTYQFSNVGNTWTRILSTANVISANTIVSNGVVSAVGNVTGNYILGNGALLTGISINPSNISSGTSNVSIVSSGGNATVNIGGTANVAVFATTGEYITGVMSASGNITGGNLLTAGLISAAGTVTGTSYLGSVVSVTANVTGGNLLTSGLISATGTITGTSHLGSVVSVTANVTGGNILTGGLISATSTITSAANITGGNLLTAGQISATGTITSNGATNSTAFAVGNSAVSNVALGMFPTAGTSGEYAIRDYSNVATNLYLDVGMGGTANGAFQFRTSNAFRQLANINSSGINTPLAVSATGNVTGNYFIGNGSQLTGIATGTPSQIVNGTSNVVVAASGNVTVGVAGTAAVATFYTAGITANSIAATNNGGAYNFKVGDDAWLGDINTADTIGIRGQQNNANGYIVFGNADGTTKLGRAGTGPLTYDAAFSAVGNVTGGNILTAGVMSSTGNAIHGNILTAGLISATGNVTGGNILTAGVMSSTGNAIHGNILTAGLISATGNVVGGNVNTSALRPLSGGLTISTVSGNLNLSPTTGNIVVNSTYINGVTDPAQAQDVATKNYVDNMVSTQLNYHSPVTVATTANLATATGGTITYTQPNGAGNGVGALLTTTGSFNLIDTANIQTVGTRILVKNEGNAVYNGIYTWANATNIIRSTDSDEYGPDSANAMSVNDYYFVQSGNVNAGSAWVVSGPTGTITFGTSNITFAQFSSSQVYSANTSAGISLVGTVINAKVDGVTTAFDGSGNISVKASANLTTPNIGAATGTSLSVTGNLTGGNLNTGGVITATGNVTGGNILTGGIISATGNVYSGNLINAGSSSITGNLTAGNILTGGLISATSTVTGSSLIGSVVTASGNVIGGNLLTGGLVSATGNITGGNANITATTAATSKTTGALVVGGGIGVASDVWAGNSVTVDGGAYGNVVITQFASVFATGSGPNPRSIMQVRGADNVSGIGIQGVSSGNGQIYANTGIIFTTGATLRDKDFPTGGTTRATLDSTGLSVTGITSATGNITGGNLLTAGLVSATSTITSAANITGGNILTNGLISATGNIISVVNISGGNLLTSGVVTATGNVTGGNVLTAGQISATGNITGNYYIGNGAFLTGLQAGTSSTLANGATNISIPVASGNIAMSVSGQANTVVINLGSLTMYGTFAGPKTLSANVVVADAVNALLLGPVSIGNAYNISVPSSSTLYVFAP